MFLPDNHDSSGPDVNLRVAAPIIDLFSAPKEGIALKYYHRSDPGVDRAMIGHEVAKFLEAVSSQLELKENNNIN